MKTAGFLPIISPTSKGITSQKALTARGDKPKNPLINDSYGLPMVSLNRYIKNHDIAQILKDDRKPNVYERNSEDILQDEVRETSANLLYLRKKYDELRETCNKKEQDTNKMRMEAEKLKAKEDNFSVDSFNAHNKTDELSQALLLQKSKIEEAFQNNRVYVRMLDRLKKDKLTDKMKLSSIEDTLHNILASLNAETQSAQKAAQFGIQTKMVFDGVMRQVESEDKKRQQSLFVFEKTLNAQEEANQKRTERLQRNQIVAETALNDLKDSNEHQWRELQLVHKFLNFFLKRKTEREIRQYETVEKAYQIIKASTGLGDTREIVNKFVNREQTYSELLISIADYEKKISELRKINEQRKAKIQSLKEDVLPAERSKDEKDSRAGLLGSYKELELVSEKSQQTKLMVEKAFTWSMQALIKMDKAKKVLNNKHYEQHSKDKLSDAFLKVFATIKDNLASLQEKDVEKVLDEIDNTRVDEIIRNEDFTARNIRVKPSLTLTRLERLKSMESPLNSRRSMHPDDAERAETEGEEAAEEVHEALESQRLNIRNKTLEA